MENTPLFSTYRQGENRVTATLLAVLQRLSLPNIDRILQALLGESSFRLVSFENQRKGDRSVLDARIGTGSAIWIETKTAPNAVNNDQVKRHLTAVKPGDHLLLLTPDIQRPAGLDERAAWSSFRDLKGAIDGILDEGNDPPSERDDPPSETEAVLLREFVSMMRRDRLLGSEHRKVLVLPARFAWPFYKRYGVYRCQPSRTFRDCDYVAFYAEGCIQPLVPKIVSAVEEIDVSRPAEIEALRGDQRRRAEELLA